jgi:hypothetical protein
MALMSSEARGGMPFRRCGMAAALMSCLAGWPAVAQQSIKILTPNTDSCLAFTSAVDANDRIMVLTLSGWAIGYVSGVAQGTGKDILRSANNLSVLNQVYDDCEKQPDKPFSLVLEELTRRLVIGQH